MSHPVPCIYVAGPYRSPTHDGVRRNIERAARLARRVWQLGCVPVCPHTNSSWTSGLVPEEEILDGYLELLSRCDAVVLTAGWRNSQGTRTEVEWAHKHDLPVFSELKALAQWLDERREPRPSRLGFL